jgi:hypothetical protein
MQVSALEALRQALFTDILELKRERERALVARTPLGHVQNLLGYILSLYCVYRWAWGLELRQGQGLGQLRWGCDSGLRNLRVGRRG